MTHTKIEWTDSSWNPITGCEKVSPGCSNCYAERMAHRLQAMGLSNYRYGFKVTIHKRELKKPLNWKKPQSIFVNSMSDIFHASVPSEFIQAIFATMNKAHWHVFQVLTKRPERLFEINDLVNWSENIWMGVSVENDKYKYRIQMLRQCDAKVKFVSFEPLLGPINNLSLKVINWVIVGGESGPRARPMKEDWVLDIHNACIQHGIPFFFKQWGGFRKKDNGRLLQGRTWDQMPASAVL